MKKKMFLAIAICLIAAVQAAAQDSYFNQDDNVVSLGLGLGGTLYSGYGYSGNGFSRMPAFSLSYERCIIDNLFNEQSALGVGGLIGYTSAKYNYNLVGGRGWKSTDVMIGARAALHYAFIDQLDTYAGIMAGYNVNSWKWNGDGTTHTSGSSGLTYSLFAGGRYYFSDSFAAFAELGYGYTFLNAGLSVKF
ncbi:MAG: hypothetical protein LBE79_08905 [Tannerella sp.]|nr:hypothetical protein [Tannerella sp.]